MKKELLIHFFFFVSFFVLISISKNWINLSYLPFWLGGIVGTLLPDLDHLIYIYFLRPYELTSQRVNYMITKGEVVRSLQLLAVSRSERKNLILHTASFQVIFLILTFLVITSSGNMFGRGLVLAFCLHLLVDQIVDMMQTDGLDNWFRQIPFVTALIDKSKVVFYWLAVLLVVLFFGFFL